MRQPQTQDSMLPDVGSDDIGSKRAPAPSVQGAGASSTCSTGGGKAATRGARIGFRTTGAEGIFAPAPRAKMALRRKLNM